jgi:protein-tyrosine phosphatase
MTVKLLFVCLGNICRSPTAEGIMNHLIEQKGLSHLIQCDSAATSNYHVGAAPDARMTAAAIDYGISLCGRGRQVVPSDLETFDYILAMDQTNYRSLTALDKTGAYQDKIRLMCSFCKHFSATDVPDPYYGGADGFKSVVELLMDACSGLLDQVIQADLNVAHR